MLAVGAAARAVGEGFVPVLGDLLVLQVNIDSCELLHDIQDFTANLCLIFVLGGPLLLARERLDELVRLVSRALIFATAFGIIAANTATLAASRGSSRPLHEPQLEMARWQQLEQK